jgi:aspartate/methionine/tyrosine aminotransferase
MVTRASKRYSSLKPFSWKVWENNEMARQAEMKKKGKEPIAITHSDPAKYGFMNQEISKYLIEAANEGVHSYGSPKEELKQAICDWEKKYHNVNYVPDDIITSPGVAGALCIIHYSVLDAYANDEICIVEPAHYYWSPSPVFESFQAKAVPVPCFEDEDWQPDVDVLRKSITSRTKYIAIDNPCNPTGMAYEEKKIQEIVNIAGENDVMIVSDEMYNMITYDGLKVKSTAEIAKDVPVIIVNGMSKFFMRTGWRVGYLAFHDPEEKIKEVKRTAKTFSSLYGHPWLRCSPIIYAAAKAYAGSMDGGYNMVKELHPLRDYAIKRLNSMNGISYVKPTAAFYIFPRVHGIGKTWKTDEEFMTELNKQEALIFALGYPFGPSGEGHFRGLLTANIQLQEDVWNRLERFLDKHN